MACDRIAVLRQSIESYRKLKPEPIIVIHDGGSTFPPMLEYLAELEKSGIQVERSGRVTENEDLNKASVTIEKWFATNDAPYYVVTDPDILIEDGFDDLFEVYAWFLTRNPDIDVVGPMLRIDDIPDHYPLKFVAAGRHYYQFWSKVPQITRIHGKQVLFQKSKIDTTFGMYRKGFKFHHYNDGIRVYAPYAAKHLDWYIDPASMTPDQVYYMANSSKVAHWGGAWLRSAPQSYVL
jgi:hypothetical protein